MLKRIIDIKNIGRWKVLRQGNGVVFSKLTLIYGCNGWGKSTLADLLRSLDTNDPSILQGRTHIDSTSTLHPFVSLRINDKCCNFHDSRWTGITPRVAIFDESFIAKNVYSGLTITVDHLKKQHVLIVGERGVNLQLDIERCQKKMGEIDQWEKQLQTKINTALNVLDAPNMPIKMFYNVSPITNVESRIKQLQKYIQQIKMNKQIQVAQLPEPLELPPAAETLMPVLGASIEDISTDAQRRIRKHIRDHVQEDKAPIISHEAWLESGMAFSTEKFCPFCGQPRHERDLINLYGEYFGEKFKALALTVREHREKLNTITSAEHGKWLTSIVERNQERIRTLNKLTGNDDPDQSTPMADIEALVDAARAVAHLFQQKQENLLLEIRSEDNGTTFEQWDEARRELERYNKYINKYGAKIQKIRNTLSDDTLDVAMADLINAKVAHLRRQSDTMRVLEEWEKCVEEKKAAEKTIKCKRTELRKYTEQVTCKLEGKINEYLDQLCAGFRIKYEVPQFRAKEPTATFHIMVNGQPVPPRMPTDGEGHSAPHFGNVLSSGDRTLLALGLFLATLDVDPALSKTIVVLDDPITSMDDFRRIFTVREIGYLASLADQVIVLSHRKSFLRLLWDASDRSNRASYSIEAMETGIASIKPYDIVKDTTSEVALKRQQIKQYVEAQVGNPREIRANLRIVLEDYFYNEVDDICHGNETLEGIIKKIECHPGKHKLKERISALKDITRYTNKSHHAPSYGRPEDPTDKNELRMMCKQALIIMME